METLNKIITSWKFDLEHSYLLKSYVPSFILSNSNLILNKEITEYEIENNKFIYNLKKWIFKETDIIKIWNDIVTKFDIENIDYITMTPDSWNSNDKNEITWFSLFVIAIAKYLKKDMLLPEIIKKMWKQKEQNISDRIWNKRGAYSFINTIHNKNLLFIDDVITSWSTMLSIGENIVNNSGNFFAYSIAKAEMDINKV